ncbi:MAG UNVERIFIED_CONTAM: hypothetical protein LVR18_07330 [Planctomycetaceae bacterium]
MTVENIFCQQWNYLYSAGYGSPEFSVLQPGRQGHDYVPVRSVRLLEDGRSIFVEIPQLHPVMQFHFHGRLRTQGGVAVLPDVFATIVKQRGDFTGYAGYAAVAKRPAPGFPIAEKYEQDPRLVQQEQYGTNFGWVSSSQKMSVVAAAGLQFEPRVMRVLPARYRWRSVTGTRECLTTWRWCGRMRLTSLASVRCSWRVIRGQLRRTMFLRIRGSCAFLRFCSQGIRNTLYFEAPQEPGEYRLVCTYPGHWRVMQGSLFVLPEGASIPESAFVPVRSFVRTWTTADLAEDVERLAGRSFKQGRAVL